MKSAAFKTKPYLINHVKRGSRYLQVQLPVGLDLLEENGAKQWKTSALFSDPVLLSSLPTLPTSAARILLSHLSTGGRNGSGDKPAITHRSVPT